MSELIMVEGQACLDYIDKPIGFGSHDKILYGNMGLMSLLNVNNLHVIGNDTAHTLNYVNSEISTTLLKWKHNTNKRVVGLVLDYSPDGGLEVAILGNENIVNASLDDGGCDYIETRLKLKGVFEYSLPIIPTEYELDTALAGGYPSYPISGGNPSCEVQVNNNVTGFVGFDSVIDFTPDTDSYISAHDFGCVFEYAGQPAIDQQYTITNNQNNTMIFGKIIDLQGQNFSYPEICFDTPLNTIAGNLYGAMSNINFDAESVVPAKIPLDLNFDMIDFPLPKSKELTRTNLTSIPFNLILTNSPSYAQNYLNNGTLPPDAFLYPLDWENLPRYDEPVPTGDEPDDYPDDNNPDDDLRDFDRTPNEIVSYTVNQLTNYNWYWLTVPQWSAFISWFWNDIGNYSDFDDIIAKVKGLYNDVASAVIMCRYYPVDISWIGGLGTQSNIKLGMIEKAGAVDTISQANALRSVDIGHVHIGQKYKSFMDMSPYSQLSLYLPWHGFIDLDMNLFNGHDVYVKALYDYLSGTIQYYVFYDNEVLVNTILCKMAMDIPITLQTKNDRDSAIFNNVSSTIGGLVGAGTGITSGNPIGMTLGITQGVGAFNSANASAPMRLMGNVGESGAYIGCQNCFVVVRRPTIQPSDGKKKDAEVTTSVDRLTTWKKNVGMLCGYGYTLSSLSGKGFTVCHSPRINFTNTAPLQSEVDEIYNYLEKGVIL